MVKYEPGVAPPSSTDFLPSDPTEEAIRFSRDDEAPHEADAACLAPPCTLEDAKRERELYLPKGLHAMWARQAKKQKTARETARHKLTLAAVGIVSLLGLGFLAMLGVMHCVAR